MTRRETLHRLAREAKPYYARLVLATLLGTLAGMLSIVPPWAFGDIVDKVLMRPAHPDLRAFYVDLSATFFSVVLAQFGSYAQTYLTAWSGQHLISLLRVRLFERLLKLPLAEFDLWRPGELMSRFSTDLAMMTDAVSVSLPQARRRDRDLRLVLCRDGLSGLAPDADAARPRTRHLARRFAVPKTHYRSHAALSSAHRGSLRKFERSAAIPARRQSLRPRIVRGRALQKQRRQLLRRVHEGNAVHSNAAADHLDDRHVRRGRHHVVSRSTKSSSGISVPARYSNTGSCSSTCSIR